jgi:hypothetical protein
VSWIFRKLRTLDLLLFGAHYPGSQTDQIGLGPAFKKLGGFDPELLSPITQMDGHAIGSTRVLKSRAFHAPLGAVTVPDNIGIWDSPEERRRVENRQIVRHALDQAIRQGTKSRYRLIECSGPFLAGGQIRDPNTGVLIWADDDLHIQAALVPFKLDCA